MTDHPKDWAEDAQRQGVDPSEVMQKAAAQMQREAEQKQLEQERAPAAAEVPEVWVIIEQTAPQRWRCTSVGKVGERTVEAYGGTEAGASGPQFRYQLACVLASNNQSMSWDGARAEALRYRVCVAEVRPLRGE